MASNGNGNGRYEPVTVIGDNRQFLYYVSPGMARILLRDREATYFGHNPPVIKLVPGSLGVSLEERQLFRSAAEVVHVIDLGGIILAPTKAATAVSLIRDGKARFIKHQPPTIRLMRIVRDTPGRRATMESNLIKSDKSRYLDGQGRIVNWTEFFREERDIYVRNMTSTNISITFGRGPETRYVSLPMSPDPINLTAEVSFEELKYAEDFRKICNAKDKKGRPYLDVMTEEEYRQYFDEKAKRTKTSYEEAVLRAEQARANYKQRVQEEINSVTAPAGPNASQTVVGGPSMPVQTDDAIRDRVRVIMHQLEQDITEEKNRAAGSGTPFDASKIRQAAEILQELATMRDWSREELEFIRDKCYWPSIKRWVSVELQKINSAPSEGEVPVESDNGDEFLQRHGMI